MCNIRYSGLVFWILSTALACAQEPGQFTSSTVCGTCHSRLEMPAGAAAVQRLWTPPSFRTGARPADASIAPAALFAGSVMAHSARDPYWKAKVRFEAANTPAAAEVIEDTCLRCHAPQQQYGLRATGRRLRLDDLDETGQQGAGCTVCHQISPTNLGTKASFTGGFSIGTEKQIYGPHAEPFAMPMTMTSGFTPAQGTHMLDSALCGSCHTVITPVLDAAGRTLGEFIEQGTYLEWLRSAQAKEGQTCQSCHLTTLKDSRGDLLGQFIAHTPGGGRFGPIRPRSPFGLHFFQGGNLQLLGMLRELFPDETPALELTMQRTRESLSSSASLEVTQRFAGSALDAEVTIRNRTGHKLPTGFPSRRMWLHVVLRDRNGDAVFESGLPDANGEIGSSQPHRTVISKGEDVVVYEAEMRDSAGSTTRSLIRASAFAKDNRILPRGYDSSLALPEGIDASGIAPVGVDNDADFVPGSDTVRYRIDTGTAKGPFRLTVELLYQSIKPSHVLDLDATRSAEEAEFLNLFPRHSAPALMARQELVVIP